MFLRAGFFFLAIYDDEAGIGPRMADFTTGFLDATDEASEILSGYQAKAVWSMASTGLYGWYARCHGMNR